MAPGMASPLLLSTPLVDTVKALSLNSVANASSGTEADAQFKIRNICCVGAGYVGKFPVAMFHDFS